MGAAVGEGRRQVGALPDDERAAAHAVAAVRADLPEHQHGAGDHARGGISTGVATDEDLPSTQLVGQSLTGVAVHHQHAAGHALLVARQRRAGVVTDIALHGDAALLHLARGKRAGIAGDGDLGTAQLRPEVVAGVALDADRASGRAGADAVTAGGAATEHDLHRVGAAHLEHVIDLGGAATDQQRQRCDFGCCLARQRIRRQAAAVDVRGPGRVLEGKGQRAHFAPPMMSCRWNWNWPSLPP